MSQWIKVKDKKPCLNMYCQLTDGERVTVGTYNVKDKKDVWWDALYETKFNPTHWQDLAEPPG